MALASLWRAMTRRKVVDLAPPSPTPSTSAESASSSSGPGSTGSPLARVLTTFDLTALGVGSTLGVGVYVLAGSVAREAAGPAVVISFAVAAIASIFAGLCYAEFGSRVPLAGSAYIYSYVSIGEFMAFVIGWNLIMEYVIGCASVARGLSNYLDQLFGNVMQESFQSVLHLHVSFLSPYIDFFAFVISFLLSVVLAFGVKESMSLNNVFTAINMAVVLFVIVAGAFKADIANWQIDPAKVAPEVLTDHKLGKGGFFPFGVMGVLRGAATCFYGFIGFDCIATTGEEVKNPKRAIPISIILSLVIIFLAYFGVSAVLTLMWPYYLQDPDAPLPYVFEQIGWPAAQWTVAVGGIFGLFASLFGAMYPLPRVIYAMANDGLIFKFLGEVHPKYKTPLVGTLLAGLITGIMAALFKLQQLVAMLSFGTLVAYTIVAACVLLLRYKYSVSETGDMSEEAVSLLSDSDDMYRCHESDENVVTDYKETTNLVSLKEKPTLSKLFAQVFNSRDLKTPTAVSSRLVSILVVLYCGLSVALGLCLVHMEYGLMYGEWGPLSLVCVISSLLLIVVLSMALQPSSTMDLPFKVPFVPVIPALSILLNTYLILMSDAQTCIRFGIWMAVGVPVGLFFIAPVVLYFISLACRSLNCCGSPPTSYARPARAPVTLLSSVHEINRVSPLNGVVPVNGGMENLCFAKEMTQSTESLMVEKCSIEVKVQCATPIPTDSSSEEIIFSDVQSVDLRFRESSEMNVYSNSKTNLTDSFQSSESDDAVSLDEKNFSDSDDNTSITEVANDLLLIIQQNEIKTNLVKSNEAEEMVYDVQSKAAGLASNPSTFLEAHKVTEAEVSNDQKSDIIDDNDEDIRSLYPDVVVISSSEEDTQSRRSSITNSFKGLIEGAIHPNLNQSTGFSTEGAGTFVNLSEHSRQDPNKPNLCETDITANVQTSVKFDACESPESFPVDESHVSSGAECEASPSKDVSSGAECEASSPSKDVSSGAECEVSSPLKDVNFVKSLEKIIGAQTLKIKSRSHPPLLKTMTMISLSPDPHSATVSPNVSSKVESPQSPQQIELNHVDEVTASNSDSSSNEDDNSTPIGNIREKLEKILSNNINSSVGSPISKSSPKQLSNPLHDGSSDLKVNYENDDSVNLVGEENPSTKNLHSEEVDETRRRMRDVLGTLRLRSQTADPSDGLDSNIDIPITHSEEMDETRKRMSSVLGTLRLRSQNQQTSP